MFERRRSGSMLCPSCGQLVGVNDEQCLGCGRRNPGMWGFGPSLGALMRDLDLAPIVMWGCGMLYLLSIALDWNGVGGGGLLGMLGPSRPSLMKLGMSGGYPVFFYHRWWTVLSAGWLHAGLLHIVFNMMAVRDLAPLASHLYGTARTTIMYTVASVCGFLASSMAFWYLRLPLIRGAGATVGASAAIFGLIGALLHYGSRGGSSLIARHAKGWAISGLIFGFIVPGVDNWAHLGGLAAGYLASFVLDPLKPERGIHVLIAIGCLLASAAAVAASVLLPVP